VFSKVGRSCDESRLECIWITEKLADQQGTKLTGFDFSIGGIVRAYESLVHALGEDWFEANSVGLEAKSTNDDKPSYGYLYHKPAHPLIEWCSFFPTWQAECERTGQLLQSRDMLNLALLGQSLEKIRYDQKFYNLINRLKEPDDFYATAWEIEVAASYAAQGLKVQFVEEQRTPTPDLYVTDAFGNNGFWVECKNRDAANDRQTQDVWKQTEKRLLQYLDRRQLNYRIVITAHKVLDPGDASKIRRFVIEAIEREFEPVGFLRIAGANGTFTDRTGKFALTIHKLCEPDIPLDGDTFAFPSPRERADFGTFVCGRRDLHDGSIEITNPRAVQLICSGATRVQHVQSAFKSAVRQLPSSGPGVIHIRLPINSWVTELDKTKSQVESCLRRELTGNQNRRVNAVIVSIYYTELVQSGAFQYPNVKPITLIVEHTSPRA